MSEKESILTQEDINIIRTAIAIAKRHNIRIWNQKILDPVKKKLKGFMRALSEERCCYCCKNFVGEFNFVVDIEHVLPKANFKVFEFTPFNLSVACKRCNMEIKGKDLSFLRNEVTAHTMPEETSNYKFIHPNFDNYFEHLCYEVTIKNAKKLIKYSVQNNSDKGKYTYEYFELQKLEIDTFNAAQGIQIADNKFSSLIPKAIIKEIQDLLRSN